MAVIYNCIYCGKEIKSNMIYEGNVLDFFKWVEDKTKELSDNCECQKENIC